ncbi:MAG: tripartite tricarboxylate transporter substrate-binding protein [Deltaproteobacteria bacterium]|nr:tripartite tricarboxylate transporter substrate-binding protein [Deltaproteobacteria bacterium]
MKRILFALLVFLVSAPNLQAEGTFYGDKTVTIVAGFGPGSLFDIWARFIAQYMGKHIPGNPSFIVQNMTGAGSLVAANYVYGIAKPDGLTLGVIQPVLYFDQLIGRKEVKFDWAKFTWIGSYTRTASILYVRADVPQKTIEDVRKASEPPKCGAAGTASIGYYLPNLFNETLGTKFNIVAGYPSGQQDLAMERGEIQCRALTVTAFFGREPYFRWRKEGFVRVLLQTGRKRDPRLPDVPTIYELMDQYKTPEGDRRLVSVLVASGDVGYPIVAAPGIQADRVKTLREAFMKTMSDPEFLAEAKKKRLEVDPTSGEELEAMAKEVITQPPEVIERMKKLLGK